MITSYIEPIVGMFAAFMMVWFVPFVTATCAALLYLIVRDSDGHKWLYIFRTNYTVIVSRHGICVR